MLSVQVEVNLYKFEELSELSKELALDVHRNFMLSTFTPDDYDPCFEMDYPTYEETLTDEDVIENIKDNNYYFFEGGILANVVEYVGKHPRAGEKVLTYKGKEYLI